MHKQLLINFVFKAYSSVSMYKSKENPSQVSMVVKLVKTWNETSMEHYQWVVAPSVKETPKTYNF